MEDKLFNLIQYFKVDNYQLEWDKYLISEWIKEYFQNININGEEELNDVDVGIRCYSNEIRIVYFDIYDLDYEQICEDLRATYELYSPKNSFTSNTPKTIFIMKI